MENVILFGNGLNRLNENNLSWEGLLEGLSNKILKDNISETLQYEDIYLSKDIKPVVGEKYNDTTEYWLKKDIADSFANYGSNDVYEILVRLPITHYMTTNYDHAMAIAIQQLGYTKRMEMSDNSENTYNIRRKHCMIKSTKEKKFIWQIHGDIDSPRSIMLGYDHYCGQIAKISSYVKGSYRNRITQKQIKAIVKRMESGIDINKSTSWIDLFFLPMSTS